ncbi:MAG: hypothetical protein LBB08_00760 [Rickettsiales bacterium]|nr:hypothetical protein [Rickettsiales bacterium]
MTVCLIAVLSGGSAQADFTCAIQYTSCNQNYYLSGSNCLPCPSGCTCAGNTSSPALPAGYFWTNGGNYAEGCTVCPTGHACNDNEIIGCAGGYYWYADKVCYQCDTSQYVCNGGTGSNAIYYPKCGSNASPSSTTANNSLCDCNSSNTQRITGSDDNAANSGGPNSMCELEEWIVSYQCGNSEHCGGKDSSIEGVIGILPIEKKIYEPTFQVSETYKETPNCYKSGHTMIGWRISDANNSVQQITINKNPNTNEIIYLCPVFESSFASCKADRYDVTRIPSAAN